MFVVTCSAFHGSQISNLRYFRFDSDSTVIYKCEGKNENCDGGPAVETQCADSSKGPLCAQCDTGYTMVYSGRCDECGTTQTPKFFAAGGWLLVIFLVLYAAYLYARTKLTDETIRRYIGARGWNCVVAARKQVRSYGVMARIRCWYSSGSPWGKRWAYHRRTDAQTRTRVRVRAHVPRDRAQARRHDQRRAKGLLLCKDQEGRVH